MDKIFWATRKTVYQHVQAPEAQQLLRLVIVAYKIFLGVPCGGIGSGSIGRDFRGGFCKFGLRPGLVERKVDYVKADQFILNVRRNGSTVQQVVLSAMPEIANNKQDTTLRAWDFSLKPDVVSYVGLFPRSWTKFHFPDLQITIICRQISPVIKDNYKVCV